MKTTAIPDCKTLVKLATDHPEKLEAINEFLKNIIILVDLTGKTEEKKRGFTVTTSKIKCNGERPSESYSYYVTITDGKREANFMNHGKNALTLADFASGTNSNNIRFWAHRSEPGQLHRFGHWCKGQARNIELCDMQNFINECLNVQINYANEGRLTYTY